jgi:hypothetical protein
MTQIALIACASQKLSHRAKASELYTSTLFRLNLQYATCRQVDQVYILSAKHGLLSPEASIEPYNVTLNAMSAADVKRWAEQVLIQLDDCCDLQGDHFVILAGIKYRKYLVPHMASYEVPMEGLRIGKQLQFLKNQIAELCPP